MDFYKVIGDLEELRFFYDNILEKPFDGESIYMCHAARIKKLPDEERKEFGSARATMFHSETSKKSSSEYTWEDFLGLVAKFETNKLAYTTTNKKPYPDKCLASYIYMNPCSEMKCAQSVLERINDINRDILFSMTNSGNAKDAILKLNAITSFAKTCHAQNPARKVWVDFDIDFEFPNGIDKAADPIMEAADSFYGRDNAWIIRTSGGYHVLVKKSAIKSNPAEFTQLVEEKLPSFRFSEIKINGNVMIPCPGTYQYENVVRVVKW